MRANSELQTFRFLFLFPFRLLFQVFLKLFFLFFFLSLPLFPSLLTIVGNIFSKVKERYEEGNDFWNNTSRKVERRMKTNVEGLKVVLEGEYKEGI